MDDAPYLNMSDEAYLEALAFLRRQSNERVKEALAQWVPPTIDTRLLHLKRLERESGYERLCRERIETILLGAFQRVIHEGVGAARGDAADGDRLYWHLIAEVKRTEAEIDDTYRYWHAPDDDQALKS